jgi:hypothetical protein
MVICHVFFLRKITCLFKLTAVVFFRFSVGRLLFEGYIYIYFFFGKTVRKPLLFRSEPQRWFNISPMLGQRGRDLHLLHKKNFSDAKFSVCLVQNMHIYSANLNPCLFETAVNREQKSKLETGVYRE